MSAKLIPNAKGFCPTDSAEPSVKLNGGINQSAVKIRQLEDEVETLKGEVAKLTLEESASLEIARDQISKLSKTKISSYEEHLQGISQMSQREGSFQIYEQARTLDTSKTQQQPTRLNAQTPPLPGCDHDVTSNTSFPAESLGISQEDLGNTDLVNTRPKPGNQIHVASQLAAVPNTVLYPEDALDDKQARSWLPQAFNYVNVDLGSQYASLITAWIALERSTHWNTHAQVRLSTIKRPSLLGKWVERKRYSVRGNEPNIEQDCGFEFAEEFEIWWISLQPGWRQGASGNKLVSPIPISK
ncbi:hypothetical protein GG344DRAFT_68879, partial [Lentinula edodes]